MNFIVKCNIAVLVVLILGCNNTSTEPTQENKDSANKSVTDVSTLKKLHFCTQLPLSIDTVKKYEKQAGGTPYWFWPKEKRALNVSFLDGDPEIQAKVMRSAAKWNDYSGLKIVFGNFSNPDVTISFKYEGSWSNVGKASSGQRPSMNFGWFDKNTSDEEFDRTTIHEFGHALGLEHEHQNPNGNPIKWDTSVVYKYYLGPPNNWKKEDIYENVISRFRHDEFNGTQFDPNSIMLYSIPKEMTIDHYSVGWNTQLSDLDKRFISYKYPK